MNLPLLENTQQIALAKVAAPSAKARSRPTEGEVLVNVLAAHKYAVVAVDLERRLEELERSLAGTK